MKPKEYIKECQLDKKVTRERLTKLVNLLGDEFSNLIKERNCDSTNFRKYQGVVKEIRTKWDAISNKIPFGLSDDAWKFFYASKVSPIKNELFPDTKKV